MRRIAFIHPGKAYTPELWAYTEYLRRNGFKVSVLNEATDTNLSGFDFEWHLMGIDRTPRKKGRIKIHEYISLSTPPFAKIKDKIKKLQNTQPDLRIFGNAFVESQMGFKDKVPLCYRDAGIASFFFQKNTRRPTEFDFVYSGATHRSRRIGTMLAAFQKQCHDQSLLIIGVPPQNIPPSIRRNDSIVFTGNAPYQDVPALLQKARFGLNFIPNDYPFNRQRPLKLLEYCAVGLPVVTTSYHWVNHFERERNARFFKLKPDFSNFNIKDIEVFDYRIPDVSDLSWDKLIEDSGILKYLETN